MFKVVYEGIKKARFFFNCLVQKECRVHQQGRWNTSLFPKLENVAKQLVSPQGNYNSPSVFSFKDFGMVPAFFFLLIIFKLYLIILFQSCTYHRRKVFSQIYLLFTKQGLYENQLQGRFLSNKRLNHSSSG